MSINYDREQAQFGSPADNPDLQEA
jgi:hypothetical protein